MTIREQLEQRETEYLSEYATRSRESRGRKREEPQCDIRPVFQRDRDRILHCKAFRRMKQKTQVFLLPKGTITAPGSPIPWRWRRSPGPSQNPCGSTRS